MNAIHHACGAQYFRRIVGIGKIGEATVQLELQLALATTHASPAVEQNAGDDNDADDDQPLAQTDIH